MKIDGKVHCLFEQSGTFKNEFKKLGYEAYDYDIQNHFGETDFVIDLFAEINKAYEGGASIFDTFTKDDLLLAFFPCIEFCDAKVMIYRGQSIYQKDWPVHRIMKENIDFAKRREWFFETLMQLVYIVDASGRRLIIENPWNTSRMTYLQTNFIQPSLIDPNRARRGDYYVKPTAYWFIGCEHTNGESYQINPNPKIVYKQKDSTGGKGICSEERSMISPDYARNFICDFILGKKQKHTQLTLFDDDLEI